MSSLQNVIEYNAAPAADMFREVDSAELAEIMEGKLAEIMEGNHGNG